MQHYTKEQSGRKACPRGQWRWFRWLQVSFIDFLLHVVKEAAVISVASATGASGLSDASGASRVTGVNPVERALTALAMQTRILKNRQIYANMFNIFQICVWLAEDYRCYDASPLPCYEVIVWNIPKPKAEVDLNLPQFKTWISLKPAMRGKLVETQGIGDESWKIMDLSKDFVPHIAPTFWELPNALDVSRNSWLG